MIRHAVLLIAASACAQNTVSFNSYPFDEWAAARGGNRIDFSVERGDLVLSDHQRQILPITIQVSSREIDKRRSHGELILLLRMGAGSDRREQMAEMPLRDVRPGVKPTDLQADFRLFVEPGSYVLECAVYDPVAKEHGFSRKNIQVKAIPDEPFPGTGKRLPPVEFIVDHQTPDSWFLPGTRTKPDLPVLGEGRVDVQLLVPTTPGHFGRVLPLVKLLGGLNSSESSNTLRLLDLAKRQVNYEQQTGTGIDWLKLRQVVLSANQGITDVEALRLKDGMLRYFGDEVRRSLSERSGSQVVIVLSAPARFDRQNKSPLPPELLHGKRLYYLQCRGDSSFSLTPGFFSVALSAMNGIAASGREVSERPGGPEYIPDDLERVLRPMGARRFTIWRPADLRAALAEILRELAAK